MVTTGEAPIMLLIGTRPEGIKMAPVYLALKRAGVPVVLCSLSQTDLALNEVLNLFDVIPDIQFDTLNIHSEPCSVIQYVLADLKSTISRLRPSLLLVQGDSTSAMAAALAGFYMNVPVGHVEAGLRTDDVRAPFPEEVNRRVISVVTTYHFAPTAAAVANVLAHGARRDQVFCTGNTSVDALHLIREKIAAHKIDIDQRVRDWVHMVRDSERDLAILSMNRPDVLEQGVEEIISAVHHYAVQYPDMFWIVPYEGIPEIAEAIARAGLADLKNVFLVEHLSYHDMVYVIDAVDIVLTDSGALQEEATSLGKPVVVLRNKTEQMEGVLTGRAWVVGSDKQLVLSGIERARSLLTSGVYSPLQFYGDGHAAEKIVAFIQVRYEQLQEYAAKQRIQAAEHEMMQTASAAKIRVAHKPKSQKNQKSQTIDNG
jgi:UDP-N-acetylglucosamine 2-epimerase (non-hydrolysing)